MHAEFSIDDSVVMSGGGATAAVSTAAHIHRMFRTPDPLPHGLLRQEHPFSKSLSARMRTTTSAVELRKLRATCGGCDAVNAFRSPLSV